jgi:6-phosphogluconolactonase
VELSSSGRVVRISADADELAARAADLVLSVGRDALERRGRFTLVLAGGSTPERAYRVLAELDRAGPTQGQTGTFDWSKTLIFFGDERLVPHDDPRSNYRMARAALLEHVRVPASNVLAIPTEVGSAAACAARYDHMLRECFGRIGDAVEVQPAGVVPRFDLILLGLGEDGHTASLFPGAAALNVDDAWVTWSPPGTLPPPVDRITLTYPVLNAAREIVFLVAGATKAPAVRDVLEGIPGDGRPTDPRQRPAAGIDPHDGRVTWMLDKAAGSLLSRTG